MRYSFGETIADLVNKDKRNIVLACDIGYGVFDRLREENPDNYVNTGITEQATLGMAAGMAMEGMKPWCYTITPFLLERPFEQIKLDVVQQKQNVKLVSYWDYGVLGPTHVTQDIDGICRILGIDLIKPSNSLETRIETERISKEDKPYFVYLTKDKGIMRYPLDELLDKGSIIQLKLERAFITDKNRLNSKQRYYTGGIEQYVKDGIQTEEEIEKWHIELYEINGKIWDLEADVRLDKEEELGLEEVGRRAIEIRQLNRVRVGIKGKITEKVGVGHKAVKPY